MPRISQQQKDHNRAKIIAAAGERFRACGIDGVGIDALMGTAGMTHGGFYNHFGSKEDLAHEVFRQGFNDSLNEVDRIVGDHPDSARAALAAIIDSYVTPVHRDDPEPGCASAARAADAARHGSGTQAEYARGLEGYLATISDLLLADQPENERDSARARREAIALFSQMVGAVVIARAVAQAAPGLADEIIASNHHQLMQR